MPFVASQPFATVSTDTGFQCFLQGGTYYGTQPPNAVVAALPTSKGGYSALDATSPAQGAVAVTPSDSTVLEPTRGIYVGVSGDLVVTTIGGQLVTFKAAPVGYHPIQAVKIMAATGATNLLALY